jgi:hypothetical protein
VILLRLFASQGDDHSMSLYESWLLEFLFADGSQACESASEAGCGQQQKRLAVG